jgi:hypothetical protein
MSSSDETDREAFGEFRRAIYIGRKSVRADENCQSIAAHN